jgi:uncharacterized zinc-type alcohol dehydrogenase-like protein
MRSIKAFTFERKEQKEVQIEILYSGVCHLRYTYSKRGLGPAIYPLVPGHEIKGSGSAVSKFVV